MSNSKCVYYKEKEQKSIDGGITWVDTGNFRKGGLISTQASQCGSFVTEYRWTKADYVCDNANKYKGYKQQVSHDNGGSWVDTGVVDIGSLIESNSKDCGYDEQWFVMTGDNNFICDGAAKYKKKEMKYTRDSGTTWNSFDPPKYEKGDLIAQTSTDCASMKVTYTDNTEKTFYNLTSIEKDTVSNKENAKEVEIYDDVTGIGKKAFEGCSSLTSITIPNSVTIIGDNAFKNCSSLTGITLSDNLTSIGSNAFSNCKKLESVTIPNSVTYIGRNVFYACSNLSSVTIGNGVTVIGEGAFASCSGLTKVTIPDGVTNIGNYAFYYCSSLTTITVQPTTPPRLGENAIPSNVTRIYVPADSVDAYKTADVWKDFADKIWAIGYDEQWFTLTGDKDFICSEGSKYKKKEMKYTRNSGTTWNSFDPPKYEKGDLIESNSSVCPPPSMKVTYVDGSTKVFYDLTSIKSDTIPNKENAKDAIIYSGVNSIGENAFNGCSSLTSITIPDSVTSIGNNAFIWCEKLTSITIPNKVKTIGDYAFRACDSITSITIPDSVISIGKEAFYPSGIKTITFEATTPPNLGDNAITNTDTKTTTIYVPASSVDKYKSATNWSSYADNIYPIGAAIPAMKVVYLDGTEKTFINLKKIVKNTDSNKANAKEIEIYDSVVRIDIDAFEDCTGLTSVKLGSSVKTIIDSAFANCSSLTSITLPNSVKTIGNNVFCGCSSLRTITVKATTPPDLGISSCTIPKTVSTIYVPASSVNAYKSAYGWKNYASKIQAIP